jgi:hypothetical protein
MIGCGLQAVLANMRGAMAVVAKAPCDEWREGIIDEEGHSLIDSV